MITSGCDIEQKVAQAGLFKVEMFSTFNNSAQQANRCPKKEVDLSVYQFLMSTL